MPYRMVWEEAEHDPSLPVLAELPAWAQEDDRFLLSHLRTAKGRSETNTPMHYYYHCRRCAGWIKGHPSEYSENTLDGRQLAGRRGRSYHCRRCGQELAFVGAVS